METSNGPVPDSLCAVLRAKYFPDGDLLGVHEKIRYIVLMAQHCKRNFSFETGSNIENR